ncbi:uncharacterized protein LOC143227919 [Tachypleus tridentatus]|uniref:uncharacterized protein LOC143227919 n=1 Tax=Tachypleus tridentatus TaxID=6853 RepID=UPI003FD1FEAF
MPLRFGWRDHSPPGPPKISIPKRDRSRSLCVDRVVTPFLLPPSPGRPSHSSGRRGSGSCSSSTDLAARRGVFSRRHYGSIEMRENFAQNAVYVSILTGLFRKEQFILDSPRVIEVTRRLAFSSERSYNELLPEVT